MKFKLNLITIIFFSLTTIPSYANFSDLTSNRGKYGQEDSSNLEVKGGRNISVNQMNISETVIDSLSGTYKSGKEYEKDFKKLYITSNSETNGGIGNRRDQDIRQSLSSENRIQVNYNNGVNQAPVGYHDSTYIVSNDFNNFIFDVKQQDCSVFTFPIYRREDCPANQYMASNGLGSSERWLYTDSENIGNNLGTSAYNGKETYKHRLKGIKYAYGQWYDYTYLNNMVTTTKAIEGSYDGVYNWAMYSPINHGWNLQIKNPDLWYMSDISNGKILFQNNSYVSYRNMKADEFISYVNNSSDHEGTKAKGTRSYRMIIKPVKKITIEENLTQNQIKKECLSTVDLNDISTYSVITKDTFLGDNCGVVCPKKSKRQEEKIPCPAKERAMSINEIYKKYFNGKENLYKLNGSIIDDYLTIQTKNKENMSSKYPNGYYEIIWEDRNAFPIGKGHYKTSNGNIDACDVLVDGKGLWDISNSESSCVYDEENVKALFESYITKEEVFIGTLGRCYERSKYCINGTNGRWYTYRKSKEIEKIKQIVGNGYVVNSSTLISSNPVMTDGKVHFEIFDSSGVNYGKSEVVEHILKNNSKIYTTEISLHKDMPKTVYLINFDKTKGVIIKN